MTSGDSLRKTHQCIVLFVSFFGWGLAGIHLGITSLVMRVATADLLPSTATEAEIGEWFGWLVCAFLFGAAAGGYLFGLYGDRYGRAKALAMSILCYSLFSAGTYFATDTWMLLVLRFLTCLGIGGVWPNAIALLTEAWPDVSRPFLAGVLGTSVNVGILCFSILTMYWYVTQEDWRWTMLLGASPLVIGIYAWFMLPESPRWLALRQTGHATENAVSRVTPTEIFRPPLLRITIIGILLGTIPLFGGWGVSNWGAAWASEAGDTSVAASEDEQQTSTSKSDPTLKSKANIYRSLPGSIASLLGGALAYWLGRKKTFFLLCLSCFICTQMLFRVESPNSDEFLFWTGALGLFSGFFFGWLPLCLPELFPTRVRSAGAGVSFNWGRILTGIGVLASAMALKKVFEGRYADVGLICGYIYAIGMVVILFAPDTSQRSLDD
ncbi:MAG: MFS transporter [Planctomycetaceae bacterium]|nr:MFS transporter [Planctomycetaceae bacterium]